MSSFTLIMSLRNSPNFIEPKDSLLCSKDSAICSYAERDHSNTHPFCFLISISKLASFYAKVFHFSSHVCHMLHRFRLFFLTAPIILGEEYKREFVCFAIWPILLPLPLTSRYSPHLLSSSTLCLFTSITVRDEVLDQTKEQTK
jgi:hypothetical protein